MMRPLPCRGEDRTKDWRTSLSDSMGNTRHLSVGEESVVVTDVCCSPLCSEAILVASCVCLFTWKRGPVLPPAPA